MTDADNIEDTYLYQLSQTKVFFLIIIIIYK